MDDGLLDGVVETENFLKLISQEPEIAKVPIMIDSSNWSVITAALKCVGGKPIINSISLKDGEEKFIEKSRYIKKFGASVVIMLFDEKGQATTFERKTEIAERAFNLLLSIGFPAENIIFDPNILTIATGIEEHNNYAVDFIRACKWIKDNLPYCKVSGGVSNLSFAFRGNDFLRNNIHSVFLHHAREAGIDIGIVNPSAMIDYNVIEAKLKEIIEDLIFNRQNDATDDLLAYSIKKEANITKDEINSESINEISDSEKLKNAIIKGISDDLNSVLTFLLEKNSALEIIDTHLMPAMFEVGNLFSQGKMFLPQVIKSASVLKRAITILEPYIAKNESQTTKSTIVLATVKGDVHDIGKNIVSVILSSNGYKIIDLGVMVESAKIIDVAIAEKADMIGLSALISSSLEEIKRTITEISNANLKIPVLLGGAALSNEYTVKHLSDLYSGEVVYVKDASLVLEAVSNLSDGNQKATIFKPQ
jgi:5-methyltetrahydrofolate--homocysteine methyltransferase